MRMFMVMNYLMKKNIFFVIFSLIMGIFTVFSNMGMISTSAVLISKAALHPEVLDLMILIVAVRFFGISRGVFRYLERIFSHDTTFRLLSSLRKWFYKNFNNNYSENNKKFKTGDIYTKIVNDVDSLKEFYLRVTYPLITAIITGIITTVFLSYFSKFFSCIYALFYIFSGFILPVILFTFSTRLMVREAQVKKELNLTLIDILKGILEVSIYSLKEQFAIKFNSLSKEFSIIQKKKNFINTVGDSCYSFSISLLIVFCLIIFAPLVADGKLSGIYYSMIPLTIMASYEALIPMPNIIYKFNESFNAGRNIFSIIESSSKELQIDTIYNKLNNSEVSIGFNNNNSKKIVNNYNISVNNLSVFDSYLEKLIIKNLSFDLPYRKKLAIVGVSGSGKSSILRSLMGFMEFQKGDIKIDNISYSNLEIDEIRKLFAYVEQNPYIFNTTIRENLLIANTEAEDCFIKEMLQKAQIISLIKELPEGLETILGQYGSNISGGEKQRLAIARALLKDSKIILLDEPTASLDVKLEKRVIDSIHSAIEDKSCIWVTHRLVSMDKMDEILVIHRGEVVERGKHSELLDNKGHYYKLWNAQQQYFV